MIIPISKKYLIFGILYIGYYFRFQFQAKRFLQLQIIKAQRLRTVDFDFPDLFIIDYLNRVVRQTTGQQNCKPILFQTEV